MQNNVSDAIDATSSLGLRLAAQLSSLRDADMTEAASDLLSAKLNLDAAFSARAKVPRTSLFDYLG